MIESKKMVEENIWQNDEHIQKLIEELRSTNERNEKLKRFNKSFEKIYKQLKAQRNIKSTIGLGYEGENKIERGETFGSKNQTNQR